MTEVENSSSRGHGGKIRGEIAATGSSCAVPIERCARAARPTQNLCEQVNDEQGFDEYEQLVIQCGETAASSSEKDVKMEAPSMLSKMRGLLDPRI